MNDTQSDAASIQQVVRKHLIVFGILVTLTLITAGVSFTGIRGWTAVAIALAIACTQGLLIAGALMHVFSERKAFHVVSALVAVFVSFLFLLTLAARDDKLEGTQISPLVVAMPQSQGDH